MANDIKAGDLVMVVRPRTCCGNCDALGSVFTVSNIEQSLAVCNDCKAEDWCVMAGDGTVNETGIDNGVEIERLIKINPPAQPESTKTRKEITA